MQKGMNKVVIVTRKTRLEELKRRFNTIEQARFYIEHLGADFSDYMAEADQYLAAFATVRGIAEKYARVQVIDRDYVANMIFGDEDVVIALGQDGQVANVMKYLDGQMLIGVNPDVKRWEGVLLPFEAGDLERVLPEVIGKQRDTKTVTMGKAETTDGQVLYAVNDFFVGIDNHTSARYLLRYEDRTENQSSSGIIVSTGLGMTGWYRSVMAEFEGIAGAFHMEVPKIEPIGWADRKLRFSVREPYPSKYTAATIVYGEVTDRDCLQVTSSMPERGVIFSDGVLEDSLAFNAGMKVTISVADRVGRLVV